MIEGRIYPGETYIVRKEFSAEELEELREKANANVEAFMLTKEMEARNSAIEKENAEIRKKNEELHKNGIFGKDIAEKDLLPR